MDLMFLNPAVKWLTTGWTLWTATLTMGSIVGGIMSILFYENLKPLGPWLLRKILAVMKWRPASKADVANMIAAIKPPNVVPTESESSVRHLAQLIIDGEGKWDTTMFGHAEKRLDDAYAKLHAEEKTTELSNTIARAKGIIAKHLGHHFGRREEYSHAYQGKPWKQTRSRS